MYVPCFTWIHQLFGIAAIYHRYQHICIWLDLSMYKLICLSECIYSMCLSSDFQRSSLDAHCNSANSSSSSCRGKEYHLSRDIGRKIADSAGGEKIVSFHQPPRQGIIQLETGSSLIQSAPNFTCLMRVLTLTYTCNLCITNRKWALRDNQHLIYMIFPWCGSHLIYWNL